MCIGIPMQVQQAGPGHAVCCGRGETRQVNTALVGAVEAGDWLLVFLNDAREKIEACRAHEINTTLDLVLDALGDAQGLAHDPDFTLPSASNAEHIRHLTGQHASGQPVAAASLERKP